MNIGSAIVSPRRQNLLGFGAGAAVDVIAGVAGFKIRVLGLILTTNSTTAIANFSDGITQFGDFLTSAPIQPPIADCGWMECATGSPLKLNLTNGTAYGGLILYQLVPA